MFLLVFKKGKECFSEHFNILRLRVCASQAFGNILTYSFAFVFLSWVSTFTTICSQNTIAAQQK